MNKQLINVTKYMVAAGLPVSTAPVDHVPTMEHDARQDYAKKQLEKFDKGFSTGPHGSLEVDKTKALEALSHRLYSVMTDAHTIGLAYLLPVSLLMLHESLMTSFWTAEEVDRLEHQQYHIESISDIHQRCFRVTDRHGKLVKAPGYTPPHISDLFETLAGQELFDFNHAIQIYYNVVDENENETELEPFIFPDLTDDDVIWNQLS